MQPTEEDIRAIRREAMERVLRSGAQEATVEIAIEIDKQANILRAVAMGAIVATKATLISELEGLLEDTIEQVDGELLALRNLQYPLGAVVPAGRSIEDFAAFIKSHQHQCLYAPGKLLY